MNQIPPDFVRNFLLCTGSALAGILSVLLVAYYLQRLYFSRFVTKEELKLSMMESEAKYEKNLSETRHILRNDISSINLALGNKMDTLIQAMAGQGARIERIQGRLEAGTLTSTELKK